MAGEALQKQAAGYCVLPGRSVAFSPAWHDDGVSVLFDRNSGDYWVVAPLARELVRHACEAGAADTASMIRHATSTLPPGPELDGGTTNVLAVLSELVALGILAQTGT